MRWMHVARGRLDNASQRCPCPNPWNLWLLLCRCDKVKDLEVRRLFWIIWVGLMWSQHPYKRKAGGSEWEKEMWGQSRGWSDALWRQRKGHSQRIQAAIRIWKKGGKIGSPSELPERTSLANTLTLAQWNWLQTSDLQNCKRILSWCYKPLGVCNLLQL